MTTRLSAFVVHQFVAVDAAFFREYHVDVLSLPFDRILNLMQGLLLTNRDEKGRAEVMRDLLRPMAGEQVRSDDPEWGAEAQGAAFMASMQQGGAQDRVANMFPAPADSDEE